jgi:phage tail protein X
MTAIYTTRDNDVLDEVVWRYYGRQDNGLAESVLEANRGLADYGQELPAGLEIVMPATPAPEPKRRLQLFS